MGVNLISKVRQFSIGTETFPASSHDVQDGCVTPGSHRVLRFDFVSSNIGDKDLVIGKPADRPDLFIFSAAHGHFHFRDFNEYRLFASNGDLAMPGKKQGFCLADVERNDGLPPGPPGSRQFDPSTCAYQGITAGWSDVYEASLPCQYIVLDGIADGDYTLVAITNAAHLIAEDNFDDNSVCTGLHIAGNAVTEIAPPMHVDLTNSTIQFLNVPEGETRLGAAVFEVRSCRSATFTIVSGPAFVSGTPASVFSTTPLGISVTVEGSHDLSPRPARIWIGYKGTAQGDAAVGTVTIRCIETAQDFVVKLTANTIARPKAVVAMVLDKSGSMLDDAGDGRTRIQVLHDSATPFVDRLHEKDSVGIVSFDQDPHSVLPLTTIGSLDDATDTSRTNARDAIINHTPNPAGLTAIGDGIEAAQNLLAPVVGSFDVVATVVLTDGQNTAPKSVDDVSGLVNSNQHIFAIGLGTPEEIDPSTLNKICAQHDGYLLMTGNFTDQSKFRLAKYYQQILASVKNEQIVTDPEGALQLGDAHRIPFRLNETDIAADIVLLTPAPAFINFTLETPDGGIVTPTVAAAAPDMAFFAGDQTSYYRLELPAVVNGTGQQTGTWTAVLSVVQIDQIDRLKRSAMTQHGIPYNLSVLTFSDLRLSARLSQTSLEPGAGLNLRAALTEYGVPVASRAVITAEIERPDGTMSALDLPEIEPGVFETSLVAAQSGIYHVHLRANGRTMRGRTFTREQLLTGQVWQGGDQPPKDSSDPDGNRTCCPALIWLTAIGVFLLLIIILILLRR